MHKIVAVTPAGRQRYLRILARYVLADPSIDRWQLWDNCRDPSDRAYLDALAREHPDKIQVVRLPGANGGLRAINLFYAKLCDPETFYIKMDDDLVWLSPRFGAQLLRAAWAERHRHVWWSPVVVNNALCSWLLKYHSRMQIDANLSAQAACVHSWRSPAFASGLHRAFISAVRADRVSELEIPSFSVSLARFSINCIGFFGSDVARLGPRFCPPEADDEEWLSAVLPSRIGRSGRIVGHVHASHFAFFTQEDDLLRTDILDEYCRLAGLSLMPHPPTRRSFRHRLRHLLLLRYLGEDSDYEIQLPPPTPQLSREAQWSSRLQP